MTNIKVYKENSMQKENNQTTSNIEEEHFAETDAKIFQPTDIDIKIENLTLYNILQRLKSNLININTDFQRSANLWSEDKMSSFIESILLGLPLPVFYFSEMERANDNTDGPLVFPWEVIDGLQRISSLRRFIMDEKDPLILQNLKVLTHLNGKKYDSDFAETWNLYINEVKVVAYVVTKRTPKSVKYHIFHKINTGGIPLEPQEIRHALYFGKASEFIMKLAGTETEDPCRFLEATDGSIKTTRMLNREFVNRFIAFYWFGYENFNSEMDTFLNYAMAAINGEKINDKNFPYKTMADEDLVEIEERFKKAMSMAIFIFGNDAFRKRAYPEDRRRPINKALFETISVNFAKLEIDEEIKLMSKGSEFREKFISLQEKNSYSITTAGSEITSGGGGIKGFVGKFNDSISSATNDKAKVKYRHEAIRKIIEEVLQGEMK